MKKIKPAYIILGVIVVIVGAFALPRLFASQPGMTSSDGDVITTTIAAVDTNASAVYSVTLLEGVDAEHEFDHMLEAVQGIPGVGEVSLDTVALELTVHYDNTVMGDSIIRDQLLAAGYVVPSIADATPTEVAEDGSVQRIAIADDGVQFNPWFIRATAGVPVELDFDPGKECRVSISFPDLGIEQDISQGGVVALPALEPGEYNIICSGGGVDGTIVVE